VDEQVFGRVGAYPFHGAGNFRGFVLSAHCAADCRFLVAYGELAIGIGVDVGILGAAGLALGLLFIVTSGLFCFGFSGGGSRRCCIILGLSLGNHSVLGYVFVSFLIGNGFDLGWAVWLACRSRSAPRQPERKQ